MNSKLKNDSTDYLFKAILSLENEEDCYRFLKIYAQAQSLKPCHSVLLLQNAYRKKVYTEIVKETGASTATISRVKRALFDNDTYGYTLVLDRIKNGEKE